MSGVKITPKMGLFLQIWGNFTPEKGVLFTPSQELNNSENGVIFTPYMGCLYSFWSYFNSENGGKILGTG